MNGTRGIGQDGLFCEFLFCLNSENLITYTAIPTLHFIFSIFHAKFTRCSMRRNKGGFIMKLYRIINRNGEIINWFRRKQDAELMLSFLNDECFIEEYEA